MKRGGVINSQLCGALAGLGHTDAFMVCDAGFPIPLGARCIDLALSFEIPGMRQCLKAILEEVTVQEIVMAKEMESCNQEGSDWLKAVFEMQKKIVVPQQELVARAGKVKFFVRIGEVAPYSNVILYAASGVEEYKKEFIIDPGQDFF